MDPTEEKALVDRLRAADQDAFDGLYELYRPRLFGFLLRLTKRRDLAEDLLQETWLRLAARATSLRPDTRLGPWLYTVARNLVRSHLRWKLLDTDRVGELGRMHPDPERNPSPFANTAATELQERLERALASLPLKYREVVLLVAIEGLSPAEAAEVCELRPAALRKRLSRARAMLQQKLAKQEPDSDPVLQGASS